MNANQLKTIIDAVKIAAPAAKRQAVYDTIQAAVDADVWASAFSSVNDKPKRVLSEEHKAKMQAGRKKAAEAAANTLVTLVAAVTPVTPVAPVTEKPKRVLTAEHKAAMQAGRKKAAAAVVTDASGPVVTPVAPIAPVAPVAPVAEKPKRVLSAEHKAKMQAGRKKAALAAVEAAAEKPTPEHNAIHTLPPAITIPEPKTIEQLMEPTVITVAGKSYNCLSDGRTYEMSGEWAGLYKNKVLDTTVAEF